MGCFLTHRTIRLSDGIEAPRVPGSIKRCSVVPPWFSVFSVFQNERLGYPQANG